jgi:hypothetical protein
VNLNSEEEEYVIGQSVDHSVGYACKQLSLVMIPKRMLKDNIKLYVQKSFSNGDLTKLKMVARNLVFEPAAFPVSLIDTMTTAEYWQLSRWQYYLVGGHV